ncbi:MAG: cyclic nucleotide-binding domain-containing protein [Desulfocapsaceae bacterium]|jgi:CRP-like cAMP-binding protein|nr:cyclic nucleotide-binding domain-containing protein [Desulfocapsaceae bacterium]
MVAEKKSERVRTVQVNVPGVDVLTEQIKDKARNGNFREAELLREQLLESNPMALDSIISSAEVIEAEKTKQLDTDHISTWSDLYDELSTEEINCLFYSLKRVRVETGKLLFVQGQPNNRLFFIESGGVTLFYRKGQKNYPVIKLSTGDILGEDSFFGISLCPFSAATQSEVNVYYLNRKIADDWRDDRAGLYAKIAEFCEKHGVGEKTAEQKSSGRRDYRRYPLRGSITAYLLDQQRKRTTTYFKGELSDVSRSGVCFSIHCSRQQIARNLLARDTDIALVFHDQDDKTVELSGTIVKLSYHLHNDYSVHLKFSEILTIDLFKSFPCDWSAEEKF